MPVPATTGQERTSVKDMQVGDYIKCYQDTATGALRFGSDGGYPELPLTAVAYMATGYLQYFFYMVKVGKGLLVADRIQFHTVAWDALNTLKLTKGKTITGLNLIPVMTAAADSAFCDSTFDATGEYEPWKAFDGTVTGNWTSSTSAMPHHIGYEFAEAKVIRAYTVATRNRDSNDVTGAPADWEFQAWDGINWIALDKRSGMKWSGKGERKSFAFNNNVAYSKYRLFITANNGYAQPSVTVGELEMHEDAGIVRSISSGAAFADAVGNASKSDPGNAEYGGWPVNNEWDKYIVKFPASSIQEGKTLDDVFHWSLFGTWGTDFTILGLLAGNTSGTTASRVIRGVYSVNQVNEKGLGWGTSNATYGTVGYRPVYDYKEV